MCNSGQKWQYVSQDRANKARAILTDSTSKLPVYPVVAYSSSQTSQYSHSTTKPLAEAIFTEYVRIVQKEYLFFKYFIVYLVSLE